jgi:cysteinyl-tRNA synthetase
VLRLYDAHAGRPVEVRPSRPRQLRTYSCALDLSRPLRVGDARAFVLRDVVERAAERYGLRTTCVQPLDDTGPMSEDDARARADHLRRDLLDLNVRPAQAHPRITESMDLVLDLVTRLAQGGYGYVGRDGSVLFTSDGGEGDASDGSPVLWQRSGGLHHGRVWDSPWGLGYPGQHVACPAIALHHLGDVIDIHTTAADPRRPFDDAERRLFDASSGRAGVRHWLRSAPVRVGSRDARAAGYGLRLADVVDRGLDPLALRLTLIGRHYREPLDLTWSVIEAADAKLRAWRAAVARWAESPSGAMPKAYVTALNDATDDDLDVTTMVAVLDQLAVDDDVKPGAKFETYAHVDRVLALDLARDVGRAG